MQFTIPMPYRLLTNNLHIPFDDTAATCYEKTGVSLHNIPLDSLFSESVTPSQSRDI